MSSDQLRNLKLAARDLSNTPLARIPRKMERVSFIVVNTNKSYREGNGTAPFNRAIELANLFKDFGYEVYFLANSHAPLFVEYLKLIIQRTYQHFVLCICGMGGMGGSDSIVFDDQELPDDEFKAIVNGYRLPQVPMTLIGEYSYAGTIFANPEEYTDGAVTITITGKEENSNAGAEHFIKQLCREISLKNDVTNQSLYDLLRVLMKRNGYALEIKAAPEADMEKPVAIYSPRKERNELIV